MKWSQSDKDMLKHMFETGHTAQEVSKELGFTVSQVESKKFRMGLSNKEYKKKRKYDDR